MDKKSVSVFCSITFYCALVNFVSAKLVPPATIEPLPDLYSFASTYPAANNVNYNASPNPQYSSNNFNNFNEVTPQPLPQIIGSYQNVDYQQKPHQQQKTLVDLATGASTTTTNTYDYSNDLKNTLVTMKDNLGFMADTQRLLLNSFKVQQQQYNDIEEKLSESSRRNADYSVQPNYGVPATSPPQYQSIPPLPPLPPLPALPPLPYLQPVQPIISEKKEDHEVHHHKKHSHQKSSRKLIKKHRKGNARGLAALQRRTETALLQRRTETARMQRHAALTLIYLKNGIVNALWTALIVACVKLAPILLFGFKLIFKSVLPLTGLALFGARGLLPQRQLNLKVDDVDDDGDIRFDKIDEDDEDDEEDELDDDDRDISDEKEEKDESDHHYS